MARGEKDHGTNWLTQHHARAIVRLLGLSDCRGCRPAHARITLPQTIPDGLLEVELPRSKKPLLLLVEWELTMLGGKTMLSQSPLYQKWMDENTCATRQEAIVSFLEERFESVPEELAAEIQTVTDLEHLKRGIKDAARCTSLKDFRKRFARR
jgi:hypothetical protein